MITHTHETILAAMQAGPITFAILRPAGKNPAHGTGIKLLLAELRAAGLVRMVTINRIRHWALATWQWSEEEVLQELENRSRRSKEYEGCLLWTEAVSPEIGPRVRDPRRPNDAPYISIRRMVWAIKRKELRYNQVVRMRCENERCIEYRHMRIVARGEAVIGRKPNAMQALRHQTARRSRCTITMEDVRAIRASTEPTTVLMARYNLSKTTINDIRAGRRWAEDAPAGMFSALIQQERKAA